MTIRISAIAMSAVASVSTPGVFVTSTPRCGAGRHVDVVVAHGHVRDDAQLRPGGVEERLVDAVVQQRHDGVGAGDRRVQLVDRQRGLLRARVELARLAQDVERRLGHAARDHDAPRHQAADCAEQVAHLRQGLFDVLERVRVGDAQVALAVLAERGAREQRDAGLVEQAIGELARVEARGLDVREGVEGAVRLRCSSRPAAC